MTSTLTTPVLSKTSPVFSAFLIFSYFHCVSIIAYQPPLVLSLLLTTCVFSTLFHHVVNSTLTLWVDRLCMMSLLVIEFFIFMAVTLTPLYQLFHFLALLGAIECYGFSQMQVPEITKKNKNQDPPPSHGIFLILSYFLISLHNITLLYSLSKS
jgi:hypothetical protein